MRQVLTADYEQRWLLPPCLEEWIGPDHPARFVREFVAALDLKALELDTLEREEGGVAYDPRLLLAAWLYGYQRKVRGTRPLERACREDIGFVWLTGNHRPDHNALWRFWHDHREGIRALFRQSVRVALELHLVGLVVQALDGTKIMAAASGRGGFSRQQLEQLLERLDAELNEREAEIARAGAGAAAGLPTELHASARLREQVRAALQRVEAGETKHAHPLEPEAARMECEGRNRFSYNAQAVVDAQAQIVVAADVTRAPDDHGQLVPMVAAAQANCEVPSAPEPAPTTLADGGYANTAQLSAARDAGYAVLTPLPASWQDTSHPYHAAHFRHDPQRQVVICPQGRALPLQRIRERRGRRIEVYRSAAVCRDCPVRTQCTSDRHGRTIDVAPGQEVLVALHARWQQPQTAEFYARRAPVVEPVFGQIKQQMGFRRWTVRGLENVRTQWALLCTTWNLQVLYRHWRDSRGGGFASAGPAVPGPQGPARQRAGAVGTARSRTNPQPRRVFAALWSWLHEFFPRPQLLAA